MHNSTLRILQAMILGATGLFLLQKIWSGSLYWYINERFLLLVLLAAVGLLALAQLVFAARPRRSRDDYSPQDPTGSLANEHEHPHPPKKFPWGLLLVALPVLLGVLIPARPLGASAVANKGLLTAPPVSAGPVSIQSLLDIPPNNRTLLDWLQLAYALANPRPLEGETADVVGFVYRLPELEDDQLMIGRFTMTCCVADAYAIGMLVDWPDASLFEENSWVRVQGSLKIAPQPGDERRWLIGIAAEEVTPVGEPVQPYLFP